MIVIFAGTRSIKHSSIAAIDMLIYESGFEVTEVVSGEDGYDRSTDMMSIAWGITHGLPVHRRPADWNDLSHPDRRIRTHRFGRQYDAEAGPRRNRQMVTEGEALIACWDGKSAGTAGVVRLAKAAGLRVYVHVISEAQGRSDTR